MNSLRGNGDFDLWQFREIHQGENDFDFDLWRFRVILQGNMILTSSRNSPIPRGRIGKSTNNHEPFWRTLPIKWWKMKRRKNIFYMCGYLLQFPFYSPIVVFEFFFIFVTLCAGVKKLLYWREVLGSLHFAAKESFGFLQWVVKGSFGSLGDRNFEHW